MQYASYDCKPAFDRPDLGMSLQVLEGGISGIPQIRTTRFFLRQRQFDTYMVRRLIQSRIAGAPLVFEGQDISLTIYMTTTPTEDGSRVAYLTTKQYDQETLKCTTTK